MSQRSSQLSPQQHRVAVLVDAGSNPFELACMTEVFGIDRPELGGALYDVRLCGAESEISMRQDFFTMSGIGELAVVDGADTVIVPNRPDYETGHTQAVLEAIARAHVRGARLIGMCSGAFTLAEAGVLAGHRVTLHWQWAPAFRKRFPEVEVAEDVLFVDDGQILTSAGSAAALDLALHVVRRDHGAAAATSVARRLVFSAHRTGGQQQFIDRPVPRKAGGQLGHLTAWMAQRITEPMSVAEMASAASMSVATLHRTFRAELGTTPLTWLTAQRVDHARELLEQTSLSVEAVARASGLGSAANLRQRFCEATGVTPTQHRRQFSAR